MATTAQQLNETVADKASLSDLTKIPEREFERQFRNWMERDEVARSLQSKLRYDLITNFNKTNLGKRLIAETTTNRLTLSPMVLALNTLVAEFLYAQDCHFTLSVFCTEVPFRNTLPDFENVRHFRFSESEILEVMSAICGPLATNWHVNKEVSKNYATTTSTSLLFFIMKALLEKSAEHMQQKVSVGTNTRLNVPEQQPQHQNEAKSDIYSINFRYLNKYLIILSKKVKEMTDQFVNLQNHQQCCKQPRVRILKSSRQRKYEDLNRSLERVTENLKQVFNAKRKSKHVDTIVKAIETLASQFQKCAINFENISKGSNFTTRSSAKVEKSISAESLLPTRRPVTARTTAASQTDGEEKSYADWVYEMRYTRNGQKFLDRIEKSLRKTMEKQKKELMAESEIRLRHHSELLKIRYKQKLIEQMYFHGGENADSVEDKQDLKASISEQFRQFEMKHFDLLSKIYESEKENVTERLQVPPSTAATRSISIQPGMKTCSNVEIESLDLKIPSSSDSFDQQSHNRQTVDDLVEEERNVNQIVNDAKSRIRELEQESNQISEHFLGYLERQRKQKLEARDAAQSVWNEYLKEREKMKERYVFTNINADIENTQEIENIKNQILNCTAADLTIEKESSKINENSKSSSSSSNSTPNFRLTNPISKAKDDFFERERKFKEETERILYQVPNLNSSDASVLNAEYGNRTSNNSDVVLPIELPLYEPRPLISQNIMAHLFSEPLCEASTDLYTLWTASPRRNSATITTTSTMASRSSDFGSSIQMAPTIATTTTTATDGHGINSIIPLTAQRPQNHSVNKSQRREVVSTTIAASKVIEKQIKIPKTEIETTKYASKALTTATTLNKNNNNVDGHDFDAQESANVHCDHNIKSDYGQKDAKPNESKNNNNHGNSKSNNNNNKKDLSESNEESSKSNVKNNTPTARKAVLQQSMARIQQLFNPHQLQRNQKQQHQIMLDDVTEEDEESATVTPPETEQQSNKKKMIEKTEQKGNNPTTNVVSTGNGCENVFSHYKNNLQLQKTTTRKTKEPPSQQKQQQQQQKQAPFIEYIGDTGGLGDGNAITIATNIRKQQNTTTTTKTTTSNGGNKAIEVMPDWQQIDYGTTSGKSSFKEKEKTIKSKRHERIEEEVVIEEKLNENSNAVELGEVIERDESNEAVGLNTFKVPEAQKQLELGELIESDASTKGKNFTAISSESSSEFHLSIGGGGDGASLVKKGLRKRNSTLDAGSDTDSDFWA